MNQKLHAPGGTYASELFMQWLHERGDRKLSRKVRNFLTITFTGFNQIAQIKDRAIAEQLIVLWRRDRLDKVEFHPEIDSLIRSTVMGVSRDWLRGMKLHQEDFVDD